jgi:hypothetical protein
MSKRLVEQRQRMIDEMIQKLTSSDPAERKAAALYLGEAAAGDAVETLVDVYENDEDRGVRKAAAYALGMFRAVDRDIGRGQKDRVIKLLDQVENAGRIGKRADRASLFSSVILLLVLAVILLALNVFLPGYIQESELLVRVGAITPTPDTRRWFAFQIDDQIDKLRADALTLQAQFNAVSSGGAVDCTAFFNNPPQLVVESSSGELQTFGLALNEVGTDLRSSRARFDNACSTDGAALTLEDVAPFAPTLNDAIAQLDTIAAQFEPFRSFIPTVTPPPTATRDPNITPSPTIAVADPLRHLTPLYDTVDRMIRPNGGASLLEQYWLDVIRTGSTDGCRGSVPNLPDPYQLPPVDAEAAPELAQAVDLINTALVASATGWTDFVLACNTGRPINSATAGINNIQAAIRAFQAALPLLDTVRDAG